MPNPLEILVFSAIDEPLARERFHAYLRTAPWPATPDRTVTWERCATLAAVEPRLQDYFQGGGARGAVILSDGFHFEDGPEDKSSFGARDLADEFANYPYSTIAVVERPDKLDDIDHTVRKECTETDFRAALQHCFIKLAYLLHPGLQELGCRVEVRAIDKLSDLLKCFQMRHKVYTTMGYLTPAIEHMKSQMEIDWFDTRSVHIGAFAQRKGHEELVGLTRLITNEPLRRDQAEWTLELTAPYRSLHSIVTEGAIPALLPVIQSHPALQEYLNEAYRNDLRIGELSRVIVDLKYRGAGISHLLITYALDYAASVGVRHVFLECLPIHEKLYQRNGFRIVSGARGRTYMVCRTMIVMHRDLFLSSGGLRPSDVTVPA